MRFIVYAIALIGVLLFALIWDKDWLHQQQQKVFAAVSEQASEEVPNIYLEDINIRTYDQSGSLITRTQAQSSKHFVQRAETLISQPVIFYKSSDSTQWQVHANEAIRRDKSEDLSLVGDVKAVRDFDGLSLHTDELHWHSAKRIAQSQSAIIIKQAFNELTSQGLKANLEQQTYELPNRVQATYYP